MMALLGLGATLSFGVRVALKRAECEVVVCFSLFPWGLSKSDLQNWCWTLWIHPADLL